MLADHDAREWLGGGDDGFGMTVNPYYLPYGHPDAVVPVFDEQGERVLDSQGNQVTRKVGLRNVDGTAMSLATAQLDYFLKFDETQVPFKLGDESRRFDSLQAFPYTESLLTGARDTFRADPALEGHLGPVEGDGCRHRRLGDHRPPAARPAIHDRRDRCRVGRRYALDTAELRLASGLDRRR